MFEPFRKTRDTRADYEQLLKALDSLLENPPQSEALHFFESRCLSNAHALGSLGNAVALLHWFLEDVNWCGYYLWDGTRLVLGPFQGMPACTTIDSGKGVCGSSFERRKPVIVDDVTKFPGHILCDPASKSEIVVPLFAPGTPPQSPETTQVSVRPIGVLDIDSPEKDRFDTTDSYYLERFNRIVSEKLSIS